MMLMIEINEAERENDYHRTGVSHSWRTYTPRTAILLELAKGGAVPNHPLSEVFGFPSDNMSPEAMRYREHRLCPFNNKVPNCTKDKANDPLGTCSVFAGTTGIEMVVTCPVRFRQHWIIADHAAEFFFPDHTRWTSLTEIRLTDKYGVSAGNIDVVLVSYDERGRILDFGAVEVQAVYISGNIRNPFAYYMADPAENAHMDWRSRPNYPRPDYLSSSRKRLAPQLIYKGGILKAWDKRSAVVVDRSFFNHLPNFSSAPKEHADIAWLVYDLKFDERQNRYNLELGEVVYTEFEAALQRITRTDPGEVENFIEHLQNKLDDKLEGTAPIAPTLVDDLES